MMASQLTPEITAQALVFVAFFGLLIEFAVWLGFRQGVYSSDSVKRRHSRIWLAVVLTILTPVVIGLFGGALWLWFGGP
jgi:hypothetical protein